MTTVTRIDRSNIKFLRSEVEAALAAVGAKHGLIIGIGRIVSQANEFRTKLTAVTKNSVPNVPGGQAPTDPRRAAEAASLNNVGYMLLGLSRADLTCDFGPDAVVGGTCKFIGYAPRRHKYPFTIRTARGKTLKVSRELAKQIAAKKVA